MLPDEARAALEVIVAQLRGLEGKPAKLAAVAQANKTARIAWAVMPRGTVYAAAAA